MHSNGSLSFTAKSIPYLLCIFINYFEVYIVKCLYFIEPITLATKYNGHNMAVMKIFENNFNILLFKNFTLKWININIKNVDNNIYVKIIEISIYTKLKNKSKKVNIERTNA